MNATSSIPTTSYTLFLNGKEMGTIYFHNVATYMNEFYPGIDYRILPDGKTIEATASKAQLLEIKEHRIKAYVIHD